MHCQGDPNCQCMDCYGDPWTDESAGEGLLDIQEIER